MKISKPLVSVDWLKKHLDDQNIIILDATLPKVTANKSENLDTEKLQIKGARFFDIKNVFSKADAPFPNTVLSPDDFQVKTQNLGINSNSCIVVYDDLGIYSSPRVWWLFKLMGFQNITILNGGLPEWKSKKYPIEKPNNGQFEIGDFKASYRPEKIRFTKDILSSINDKNSLVADARSKGRFLGTSPEPRKGVKSGHIPNSVSLPYSDIIEEGKMISEEKLKTVFEQVNSDKKEFIFSCGTGITACVLALGAELLGYKNYAVYDGSWTEWGSINDLPIEI